MRFHPLLAAPLVLAACADSPAPAGGSTTDAPGSTGAPEGSSTTEPAEAESSTTALASTGQADGSSSTGPASLQPIALERDWVDALGGPWLGPVTGTPMGDLPQFYWEFAWTADDAMVGVADNGMGFRFELAFVEVDGQWTMTETGTLPGNMTQSYVLHPVEQEGARVRFEVLDRPGFLQVDVEPTDSAFGMDVLLRGEGHGSFDLARPG